MKVSSNAAKGAKAKGILRLRETTRCASRLAPLRMTRLWVGVLVLSVFSGRAGGTTYYVSSSSGSDAGSGTSAASAWQTIAHVNGQTFQPGDSILFKRGDVWNESLAPASSGSSGSPITFDAYGTGAAPNLTGYYAVPSSAWALVTGNAWKAPLPATYSTINFCLFGSIWGQKVGAVSSNLTAQWDFYLANGYVYVYSVGSPALYYSGPIVPMALSNVPVISVSGKSWLTFQHFLVNWFDQYGVYVQGTSDHLVFANMEADSMIPQGTQPLGFYVNESAPGPGDIKIYNSEAHLNYDGFRFDRAATAITMVNDKAYANRDGALVDNTSAVSYSYCHFYASSLAVAGSTDVEYTSGSGPTAGAGNIPGDTAPAVQAYQRYPAEVTLTVDDAGMTPNADTYYASTVLPIADAAGVPVGVAITVGYAGTINPIVSEIQGWINAGRDVTSHSVSHTYYTNTDALDIQYTGSGTAATLSISGKTLTMTVTGASDSVSYNLAQGQAQGTIKALRLALLGTGKFTATENPVCQGPYGTGCSSFTETALLSQDLADVSGQNVKSTVYSMLLDTTRLTTDEITLSRQWMNANLTGLPATPVYVYPGGYETTTMQGITAGVPYNGARGALKEDLGVSDTYADGFNVQNITSFGVNPSWMGLQPPVLNQKIQALLWKESVWGVPWGVFWHLNELTNSDPVGGTEITNLMQDLKTNGATIRTNTSLVNWLLTGTQETGTDGNYYYKIPATSMMLDFRPTKTSPVVDAGANLGTGYALDINGVNQNSYGSAWEIGAHVYQGYGVYGEGTGGGRFTVGGRQVMATGPQLPLTWVDNNEATDGLVYAPPQYELNLATQSWVTGVPTGCTFHTPYWAVGTPTSAGLQSAVNDAESCRTTQNACTALDIPPADYAFSGANGLVIPQSNSATASCFIVLRSTQDSSLPNGRTVCAHGMQDNLATSADIGLHNPDCSGQNMYYELAPQSTAVDAGGSGVSASMSGTTATFTLASGSFPASFTVGNIVNGGGFIPNGYRTDWRILTGGAGTGTMTATSCPYVSSPACLGGLGSSTATGTLSSQFILTGITTLSTNTTTLAAVTSAEVSAGIPVLISLANGYVTPGVAYTMDTGSNQETVTPVSGPNQSGMWATFTKAHAFGVPVTYNVGPFTLANGTATNTSNYNDLQYMWQVTDTGGSPVVTCSPISGSSPQCASGNIGPDHWLIEDLAASMPAGNNGAGFGIGIVRNGAETAETQYSSHIHLRKDWAHGDWTSLYTGANSYSAGIEFWCFYCSIVDSQISQTMRPGAEGHAIGADGSILKIDHNWIETGASGIFSGGFSGGTGPSSTVGAFSTTYVPFCDVEERRNWIGYVFPWLGYSPVGSGLNPNINGSWSTVRKNVQEQKEGCRILSSGNLFQDSSLDGGQDGIIRSYSTRNNSSGFGSNYQAVIHDVTDEYNIYRHGCEGGDVSHSDDTNGNGGGMSFAPRLVSWNNDLWYDLSAYNQAYCFAGSAGDGGFGWESGAQAGWTGNYTCDAFSHCTFTAINSAVTGSATATSVGFQAFDAAMGDPEAITGCTVTALNSPTTTFGGNTFPTLGYPVIVPSALWNGTYSSINTTVVLAGTGAQANLSDTSGTCTMLPIQSSPQQLSVTHNTVVSDSTHLFNAGGTLTGAGHGPNYMTDGLFQNDILVSNGGWVKSPLAEGCTTIDFMTDTTTLTDDHLVLPTRSSAAYSGCMLGNNPVYPVASPVMYFPATPYCTGATSTSACVGFVGAMSASSMPLNSSDYHNFELRSDSSFYAGASEDASDGTSMGTNVPAIDAAETRTTYVCQSACGTPGPFHD